MSKLCPKCGGLMRPRKIDGKLYLVCTRCGYKVEADASEASGFKVSTRIDHKPGEKTLVLESGGEANLPVTREVTCPKCGWHEAYYWVIQTRAADEPPTRFFKCTKCGYTWREYA
ncbi:transcription factor S [Desulfurococcus amylolyticus]|uniref:Transcription termination factor Tfs n=1 Tax=Desulfurococcus amylolyticus DSM 16532 TaxID=768672 RepID=I3XPT1_DESAM|nr:transcription factor S [Desulfurococcus amylolyticus]AFL65955.1 transcription termination factor Tfs [Desulfurococcus amylolyticus DSM 16532]